MNVDDFIERWSRSAASERANYQLFLSELCDVLGVPRPDPATGNGEQDRYVFEYPVTFRDRGQRVSSGFIDLYKAGCFVLEAKQSAPAAGAMDVAPTRAGTARQGTRGWDVALERAYRQAMGYATALPNSHGWPPFLVVVDVGHVIELYSDFSRQGRTWQPYPDARASRISMADLRDDAIRDRLRRLFVDPLSLDPSREAARVTAEVAGRLADLARSLEAGEGATGSTLSGQPSPKVVASFLMRCLFAMFAEDAGLLPEHVFENLLKECVEQPDILQPLLEQLFADMDKGGFSSVLRGKIRQFNGGLFADRTVLPLTSKQIGLLLDAARADWRWVEPAIFGTLLERALDPRERHKLGAHYTPRAYVERLVLPTVLEPLREEWDAVRTAAQKLLMEDKRPQAVVEVRKFHQRLCKVRVLDPACGTGNFLYVTLEHMKRLEGEVVRLLDDLDATQAALELEGFSVNPSQFLGIEVNPRAAQLAELVLWIGYLQWQLRTGGVAAVPTPVLQNFGNIECRDAVLAWDRIEQRVDDKGLPVTRWDGVTTKKHPVTGEDVPDEKAVVPVFDYINPRQAEWPKADFVVGNPPFLGDKTMRRALGDGYVEVLRAVFREAPDSIDFVMYWWMMAGRALQDQTRRAGLISTNSVRQIYNGRTLADALTLGSGIICYAVPDHPWIDAAHGAAVRISIVVVAKGESAPGGELDVVVSEATDADGVAVLQFRRSSGSIHTNLAVGADVASAKGLLANAGLSCPGVKLFGQGFVLDDGEGESLRNSTGGLSLVRRYLTGRAWLKNAEERWVIDALGLDEVQLRDTAPAVFQHLLTRVAPERKANNRESYRRYWWVFGEPRRTFRKALLGLPRQIVTVETSKHRYFGFIDADVVVEGTLIVIASADAAVLGTLSSRVHVLWSLSAGGRLGVGNDPRYNKTRCFDPFPFPAWTDTQRERLRTLGEQLDAHRKGRQALHPELTLTDMYNVLQKLRDPAQPALNPKERRIHDQGLVSVLRQIHDDIDVAVAEAYGWPADLDDDALLERLVALNAERAAEEAAGHVRWLRPEYQDPARRNADPSTTTPDADADSDTDADATPDPTQTDIPLADATPAAVQPPKSKRGKGAALAATETIDRLPWPSTMSEQAAAVMRVLQEQPDATAEAIATRFFGVKAIEVDGWIGVVRVMGR